MARRRGYNYWKLFSIAVIIAAICYGIYLIHGKFSGNKTQPHPSPLLNTGEGAVQPTKIITTTDQAITDTGTNFSVNVVYPKISGLSASATTVANQAIKSKIETIVSDFKSNSMPEAGVISDDTNTLNVTYDKSVITTATTATVIIRVSQFYSGAAQPNAYGLPISVAIATGELLNPQDFFKPNANYLASLSQAAIPLLKKQLGSDFFAGGATPTTENYDAIYPTDSSLVVLFAPTQVAPYSSGVVKIEIPRAELQTVLK